MTSEANTTRDRKTGRYSDTKLNKPCQCGHTLGQHAAEKNGSEQPCFAEGCPCEVWKKK